MALIPPFLVLGLASDFLGHLLLGGGSRRSRFAAAILPGVIFGALLLIGRGSWEGWHDLFSVFALFALFGSIVALPAAALGSVAGAQLRVWYQGAARKDRVEP